MVLSVIVTSYESPETLRQCLKSLSRQEEAGEIVVSDCSRELPERLKRDFPAVRFLQFGEARAVPELRWAALPLVTGEVVAAVEARCVPSATWCAELLAAHRGQPDAPAVGGPVTLAPGASAFDWGLYFCEYGAFAPPVQTGEAPAISGANLSYKRAALEACADLTGRGEWETLIHEQWRRGGLHLWLCQAAVEFRNSISPATALTQRWHYGRGYAADRVRGAGLVKRLAYAAAGCALPLLLLARIALLARQKRLGSVFLRACGWVALLSTAWSAGEIAGYLAGQSRVRRIF